MINIIHVLSRRPSWEGKILLLLKLFNEFLKICPDPIDRKNSSYKISYIVGCMCTGEQNAKGMNTILKRIRIYHLFYTLSWAPRDSFPLRLHIRLTPLYGNLNAYMIRRLIPMRYF